MRARTYRRRTYTWRWTAGLAGLAVLGLALVTALAVRPAEQVQAASFTVNVATDDVDPNPGDGICDSDSAAGNQCSLRAAIGEANASPAQDLVSIGVAGPIVLLGGLPTITDNNLVITGGGHEVSLSAPGTAFSIDNADGVQINNLVIDGGNIGTIGIQISGTSEDLVLDGLAVRNFTDDGFNSSVGGGGRLNVVRNSTFTHNGGDGIDFDGGQDDIVQNNLITNNGDAPGDNGLEVTNENNFLIQGNTLSGNFNVQIMIENMAAGQSVSIIQNTIISGSDGIVVGGAVNPAAAIDIGLSVPSRNVFRGAIAAPAEQHLRNLSSANINAIYNDWNAYTEAAIEGAICHDEDPGCGPGVVDFEPFIDTPSPFTGGLAAPGGIAALPSAAPAIPGVANQGIPAIVGSGQPAIVVVFCDDGTAALPSDTSDCANPIALELTRLYPESGTALATFAATNTDTLVVTDNAAADMDAAVGVIAVEVDAGWGANEIVKVDATDDTGDTRTTSIVVVDTMLAWGPAGQVSTASQEQPVFVSYHCDVLGRAPVGPMGTFAEAAAGDGDGEQGQDDMYDGLYGPNVLGDGPGMGWGSNTLAGDADFPDVWCGGDTQSLFDDFVDFQTDKGIFSVDPAAALVHEKAAMLPTSTWFYPPIIDFACGEGKNIDSFDIDALSVWSQLLLDPTLEQGGCDIDGWRNGVVTTEILANGEVGVATITGRQGGGVSPPRTVNVTFIGPAVGGIAELPDFAGMSAEEAGTPAEGSGWPTRNYTALAGGLAAAVVVLTGAAWYARRRWLR